ncbi:FtsB/FtsL family cell division protein [Sphingomonas radiodurans]|uniref:hypothetical protein n=1 Tax=Sphingomonas radiodurans TaxID=2890321 RepID=UPI001E5BA5FC|nr:hypothetical protein [Sphingomonas radiodurans]WBH16431.1 hypothetical protein LLW23_16830 [Sphingomonas radiodurans]
MTNSDAVTRIDAAIRRIEAAIERRERENTGLRQRHDALRSEVTDAIASIDAIISQDPDIAQEPN